MSSMSTGTGSRLFSLSRSTSGCRKISMTLPWSRSGVKNRP